MLPGVDFRPARGCHWPSLRLAGTRELGEATVGVFTSSLHMYPHVTVGVFVVSVAAVTVC